MHTSPDRTLRIVFARYGPKDKEVPTPNDPLTKPDPKAGKDNSKDSLLGNFFLPQNTTQNCVDSHVQIDILALRPIR